MRLKITFRVDSDDRGRKEIPINYQYELSSIVYKIIANVDESYSKELHDVGFMSDLKHFRLFSFSRLFISDYEIDKERERLIIKNDRITWYLSFAVNESSMTFVKGALQNQHFRLADNVSGVWLDIVELQLLPEWTCGTTGHFRTQSPICVTKHLDNNKIKYMRPDEEGYEEGVLTGLLGRYKAIYGMDYGDISYCHLQTLSKPKSSLIKIKAGTAQQTFVRGYCFDFILELPEELMKVAYDCGIGEKCSMGFGMIKAI